MILCLGEGLVDLICERPVYELRRSELAPEFVRAILARVPVP